MKSVRLFLTLCASLCLLRAQDDNLPTLFVAPFDGDRSEISYWQHALGEGLAEMLITELSKTGKFQMLESTAIESLKDEIRMGEDGWVAKDERVEKGGWAGADYMFRGKVTRFGAKSTGVDLGGFVPGSLGGLGLKKNKSDVRIDWRIVDVANRKIFKTGQAVGSETGLGFKIGVAVTGHGGNIGFDNKEFMESALGKATVKALNQIVSEMSRLTVRPGARQAQKINAAAAAQESVTAAAQALRQTPGKVLAVPAKGVLIVSLGSQHGFKAGDKLKLYETVDLKDDKGAVVFTEEKLVGEITLDAVQEDRSKAAFTGSADVKTGWVVKAN